MYLREGVSLRRRSDTYLSVFMHCNLGLIFSCQFHQPIKNKKFCCHLSYRVVNRVSDSMQKLRKFLDSYHLSQNKSWLIKLIFHDIILPGNQLSLNPLEGISQQFSQHNWNVNHNEFKMRVILGEVKVNYKHFIIYFTDGL